MYLRLNFLGCGQETEENRSIFPGIWDERVHTCEFQSWAGQDISTRVMLTDHIKGHLQRDDIVHRLIWRSRDVPKFPSLWVTLY